MNKETALKYKDYPEGSGGKKIYDRFNLTFQSFLNKYYSNIDLTQWEYINIKFINPLFDSTNWDDYLCFLEKAKPNFLPIRDKVEYLTGHLKDDIRFNDEFKRFFSFLYSIDFFRDLTFEEWLNVNYWSHPWNVQDNEGISILKILEYENSVNFLKERLSQLPIF